MPIFNHNITIICHIIILYAVHRNGIFLVCILTTFASLFYFTILFILKYTINLFTSELGWKYYKYEYLLWKRLYFEAKYNFYIINLLKHKIVSFFAVGSNWQVYSDCWINIKSRLNSLILFLIVFEFYDKNP